VDALDRLLGGLPVPGLVELHGPAGAGATRLAALALAAHARRGQPVAWIDGARTLYPPALEALGLDLDALLVVRPPAGHLVWATEQILRSGAFPAVAVSGVGRLGRGGPRWSHAAEVGRTTALVVGRAPQRALPADVRLSVDGQSVTVVRDRAGAFGRRQDLPPWPEAADPWQIGRAHV